MIMYHTIVESLRFTEGLRDSYNVLRGGNFKQYADVM